MHELDDERPIPLGRAAATTPAAAEPAPRLVEAADPPAEHAPVAAPVTPAQAERPAAHIERTRRPAAPQPDHRATEPAPNAHPMAGLRGFRMEVQLAKPAGGGCLRDLGCFLATYLLVVVLLLALIEGYLALSARVGSGGA